MRYETVLVAFVVEADDMKQAQEKLLPWLPRPMGMDTDKVRSHEWLDCWWVAEDERYDGSDCDSAVFVPGVAGHGEDGAMTQAEALAALRLVSDMPNRLSINVFGDGFEVIHGGVHGGRPMLGLVTEESEEEYEEGCYDYVVGHWPDGEQWVELTRWPVDLDTRKGE